MHYLVATDGSTVSDRAVEHAADEASVRDAALEIVHVLTPETKLVDGDIVLPGEASAVDHAEGILDAAVETAAAAAGRPVNSCVSTAIPEYAENAGVDAVFVGHRGRSETPGAVGSVAKSVIDRASVPVTVTR